MTMRFREAGGPVPVIWDGVVIQGTKRVAFAHPGRVYWSSESFRYWKVLS